MRFLLDTNVLREIGRAEPQRHVAAWLAPIDDTDLAVSALTVREISKGVALLARTKPDIAHRLHTRVGSVLDAFGERILPVDRQVAAEWGRLLAASGRHADDAGLAATARVHGLTLVTRNIRDFRGRGVRLLDPFRSPPREETA